MKHFKNIHPGDVLLKEFLIPMSITTYRLSKDILISQSRVAAIIKGTRRIASDTALSLSIYFGNSPKFWLGLQDDYDIEQKRRLQENEFGKIDYDYKNAQSSSKSLCEEIKMN